MQIDVGKHGLRNTPEKIFELDVWLQGRQLFVPSIWPYGIEFNRLWLVLFFFATFLFNFLVSAFFTVGPAASKRLDV